MHCKDGGIQLDLAGWCRKPPELNRFRVNDNILSPPSFGYDMLREDAAKTKGAFNFDILAILRFVTLQVTN